MAKNKSDQNKPARAHDDSGGHSADFKRTAANRRQPTKPAPARNPTGVDHNPAQGSPSTRRNPEAGKE